MLEHFLADPNPVPGSDAFIAARDICEAYLKYIERVERMSPQAITSTTLLPLQAVMKVELESELERLDSTTSPQGEAVKRRGASTKSRQREAVKKKLEAWKYERRVHVDPAETKKLISSAKKACEEKLAAVERTENRGRVR